MIFHAKVGKGGIKNDIFLCVSVFYSLHAGIIIIHIFRVLLSYYFL